MFVKAFFQPHQRFWMRIVTSLLAACVLSGCGGGFNAQYHPTGITGKVVRKDGEPLPGPMVIALVTSEGSPQVRSTGIVKPDGTIEGLTFVGIGGDGRAGMIPGKHYVEFNRVQKIGEDAEPPDPAKDKIWKEFLGTIPKPLMVEIGEGDNEVTIEI